MKRRTLLLLAWLAFLPACVGWQKMPLTGCDHPSGWCDQIRAAARESFEYAQMSTNAYASAEDYKLAPEIVQHHSSPDDDIGFAYAIFHRKAAGELKEVVIAYRGTRFSSPKDWWHGNLFTHQNTRGHQLYKIVRQQLDDLGFKDVKVTVTGHSLGGGISTHVSLREPEVSSYIFNASPRFTAPAVMEKNRRLSVVEHGEILKAARVFGREADQEYISIGCTRGRDPVGQHKMRRLGDCLTRIAAHDGLSAAKASLVRNNIPLPSGLSPR